MLYGLAIVLIPLFSRLLNNPQKPPPYGNSKQSGQPLPLLDFISDGDFSRTN
ncbi:hypothetical protein EFIBHEMM_01193 [Mannheimia haemolytica]